MKRIGTVLVGTLMMIGSVHAQPLKKLVLFGQPSVNNDAIWMALEYGYFKEQGLEVDYRVFPSGTTAFQTFRTTSTLRRRSFRRGGPSDHKASCRRETTDQAEQECTSFHKLFSIAPAAAVY